MKPSTNQFFCEISKFLKELQCYKVMTQVAILILEGKKEILEKKYKGPPSANYINLIYSSWSSNLIIVLGLQNKGLIEFIISKHF